MAQKEGELLKNRLKGTGKTMPEISAILGMTRQNLNYHLRKDKLDDDFKRLLNDKGKYIFHVEQSAKDQFMTTLSELAQAILKQSVAIEKHANTIDSQQKTIHLYAEREQPSDTGKNDSPSSKTSNIKVLK